MRKVIAAMNMTLDGYCDHTAMIADDEIHQHYSELLRTAGTLVYGRVTFQLMEFWPTLLKNPTGNKSMDDFAVAIDSVPKIVFSRTLKNVEWKTARVAARSIEDEVTALKSDKNESKNIFVGSPGMIVACLNLNLVDELQLCVQPIIEGKGLALFKNISQRINLRLLKTKTLANTGSTIFYYEVVK